jgi:hypothetical protein
MAISLGDSINGYTPDQPEYWTLMAKTIGNPIPDEQDGDDSKFIDENGTVLE